MSNVTAIGLIGLGVFGIYLGATGRLKDTWNAAMGSVKETTGQGGEAIIPPTRGGYYGTTLGVLNISDEGYY
jgi:hypothetical protein